MKTPDIEAHPLPPFLPPEARLLLLGSFPPPRRRWSMEFYYPNFANDMWRIMGLVFFGDRNYFIETGDAGWKTFRQAAIINFLTEKGIALYDTAAAIRRLQGTAADQFLEIVTATDVKALLRQLPRCQAIAATGQKAADALGAQLAAVIPKVGVWSEFSCAGRTLRLYRMPSTSRAYPVKLELKAAAYGQMMRDLALL